MPTDRNNIPEEIEESNERVADMKDGLDFEISEEEERELLQEIEDMRKHPERYKSYHSFEELVEDILKEDD